jgi:predicted Zn finger-like uncharacterized protein
MIVACPSCSARFKVAEEKIGPQGAKLRCSKCQKVFGVQREAAPAAPPPPPPGPAFPGGGVPSPDLDLEPAARPLPPPLPALSQPDDPFAPRSAPPPVPSEASGGPPPPAADPFARFHPSGPPAVSRPPPIPGPPDRPAAMPFAEAGTADLLAPREPPLAAAPPRQPLARLDEGLALEEPTIRPSRQLAPTPVPTPGPPADGWLGELADGEADGRPGDAPSFPDVIPDTAIGFGTGTFSGAFPAEVEPARPGATERPAPRSALEEVTARRRAAVAAGAASDQARGGGRGARLRLALVDALSLAVLLLAALALAAYWRGGLTPAEALRPGNLLVGLTPRPSTAGVLEASQVQSAFYERRRGPPLLFVRGLITSRAAAAIGPVRVSVDVVRDGRVLAHLEGRAGGPLGPEALAEADSAPALARFAEAAAAAAPPTMAPGESLPFLVALAEVPPGLEGAAVRVSADAEGPR